MSISKNILITGGSRGIGRGFVRAFAQAGYKVMFSYHTSTDKANELREELNQSGIQVHIVQADLENVIDIKQLVDQALNELGKVDILINNAAVLNYKNFFKIGVQEWDRTQAVNIRAPMLLSQLLLPGMMTRGWGRIINMASIGGQWGGTLAIHYATSKAAVIGLTRSIAKLCARDKVTVNAISPGLVATEMIAEELNGEGGKRKIANIPVGRIADIEEVVSVALFLASDSASYITGQTINVNGGMYFG